MPGGAPKDVLGAGEASFFVAGRKASIAPLGALSSQAQMALQEGFPREPRALGWKREAKQSSQYNWASCPGGRTGSEACLGWALG